jgi:hypothetical protein
VLALSASELIALRPVYDFSLEGDIVGMDSFWVRDREVIPRDQDSKIFRNGRVWCAIDTLLCGTFDTITDARGETDRRLADLSLSVSSGNFET